MRRRRQFWRREPQKPISTRINANELQAIFKDLLSELQSSILSQQLRKLANARHGKKKHTPTTFSHERHRFNYMGAGGSYTSVYHMQTTRILRKKQPIPLVSAYATDIIRVPNNIHIFWSQPFKNRKKLFWHAVLHETTHVYHSSFCCQLCSVSF